MERIVRGLIASFGGVKLHACDIRESGTFFYMTLMLLEFLGNFIHTLLATIGSVLSTCNIVYTVESRYNENHGHAKKFLVKGASLL